MCNQFQKFHTETSGISPASMTLSNSLLAQRIWYMVCLSTTKSIPFTLTICFFTFRFSFLIFRFFNISLYTFKQQKTSITAKEWYTKIQHSKPCWSTIRKVDTRKGIHIFKINEKVQSKRQIDDSRPGKFFNDADVMPMMPHALA